MAVLDIIVIVIVVAGAIYGFIKGIIQQLGAVLALVAGVAACRLMGDAGAAMLTDLFSNGPDEAVTVAFASRALANVIIFAIVYFVVKVLARGLKMLSRIMLMGPVDKALGAVFTVVEWIMALSIVLNLWCAIFPSSTLVESASPQCSRVISTAMKVAPSLLGGDTVDEQPSDQNKDNPEFVN